VSEPTRIGTSPPAFDWYAATVEAPERRVIHYLAERLQVDEMPRLARGRYGFAHGTELRRRDRRVATVFGGGHNPEPFAEASSEDAVELAAALRSATFGHRVSRVDAKVDVPSASAYDVLASKLIEYARSGRAAVNVTGDPDKRLTVRGGAASSPFVMYCYDKAEEQGWADREALRVESRWRPRDRADKQRASGVEAADVFGQARWGREYAENVLALSALPPPPRQARTGDLDRALMALARQYGPTLDELLSRCGGDVGAAWEYIEELRRGDAQSPMAQGIPA
jgi:hypothetical protein